MSLGTILAGGGLAIIGFLDSYPLIFAATLVSGIGIALFHPEGGRIANLAAGENKGTGMSIFAVGGNIGFMVGPIIASAALMAMGMTGTIVLLISATIAAGILLTQNGKLKSLTSKNVEKSVAQQGRDRWGTFSLVVVLLSLRPIVFYALTTLIPLLSVIVLSQTEIFGSTMPAVFSAIGGHCYFSGRRLR
jgi:FSR family fosmidomycin resistance protein-like MFS transporter